MIITISGDAGAGKSTIAGIIARNLKFRKYSVGDFMREIARKRKTTLLKIGRLAENDPTIDEELDDMQRELGKYEDHFVLDSRLGYHFIPKSFRVHLKVDPETGAKRIFRDKRKTEKENLTLKKTLENVKKRKKSEIQRYKKYYNLNPYDKKNYDLVIDTSKSSPEETAEKIIVAFNRPRRKRRFGKRA